MLKLVSVNIEGSRHTDKRVVPFLKNEHPDIVCLQELSETDVEKISALVGPHYRFVPTGLGSGTESTRGIGIFSHTPFEHVTEYYYRRSKDTLSEFAGMDSIARAFLVVSFAIDGISYVVGTTHFTWSGGGIPNDAQREDLPKLLHLLAGYPSILFCGDFNLPRGGTMFATIAERYTDHIPSSYTTSIDGALHKNGPQPHMVDGLFSTVDYRVSDVCLQSGVSDHCAVLANVEKL